ncbi:MAG TPA: indole-3-glycerol-phosphate synthase [Steroidobacteraceae bacterium]
MSADFLTSMAQSSRARVARARAQCADAKLRALAHAAPAAPVLALSKQGFDLIAEVKLRSPAAGPFAGGEDIAARAGDYAAAGAAAISVLTEPTRFDGELAHLELVARALARRVPVMRKDFLVDPYQVYEARVAGAGGVLVILRMLERSHTVALLEAAAELGLFALLEAFDEQDLQLAAELVRSHGGRARLLVGVNCRDLSSLQVVPGRLEALAPGLPAGVPRVAESGVESAADAARLAAAGYDVALVGSALMRAHDRVELARALLAAGRQAHSCG